MIKELEDKYNTYEIKYLKDCISDKDLFLIGISKIKKDFNKMRSRAYKKLLLNSISSIKTRFVDVILGGDDVTYFLDSGDNILYELIDLCDENDLLINRIEEYLNDDNYLELIKLLDFQIDYFISNYNYFMSLVNRINRTLSGISFLSSEFDNNRVLHRIFMNEKIKKYKPKNVEKSIKM